MLRVCVALLATARSPADGSARARSAAARALRDRAAASEPAVEVAPYVEIRAGPVGLTATEDGTVWVVARASETACRIPAGATAPDLTVDAPACRCGPPRRTARCG